MSPFVDMFEMMQRKVKAQAYADRIVQEREESPLSSSKSLFDLIDRLKQPTTTTTPQPPLIERLLRPYFEPWKRQLDDFSKDITVATVPPLLTTPPRTTSRPENLFERSLKIFLPSLEEQKQKTTLTPKTIDGNLIEQLFSRQKRMMAVFRKKRQALSPKLDIFDPITRFDAPLLELTNPFTPNPLMSLFTTLQPFPELPPLEINNMPKRDVVMMKTGLPEPHFRLQDPFYNPLFPKRKNKLFGTLSAAEAK